ncbi:hypothetical protein OUZ56_030070 [Daphnia magna]|uniref:Uncharacterized protein n=1 Tax=Daphnia magna TaxID=35525 RepID=A0ABQ9ZQ69_9CRUS|nr:hypothetical protein OUZ56_030070 [Daphnia magna]
MALKAEQVKQLPPSAAPTFRSFFSFCGAGALWVDGLYDLAINSSITISSIHFATSLRVARVEIIRYTFTPQLLHIHGGNQETTCSKVIPNSKSCS